MATPGEGLERVPPTEGSVLQNDLRIGSGVPPTEGQPVTVSRGNSIT